nr:hypothetical protein [uncultured Oscillibacter sp.]
MDHEKMAQDLATAFAVSQQVVDTERPQIQLQKMLEDYCAAYGFSAIVPTSSLKP